jgi:hypothetical protein
VGIQGADLFPNVRIYREFVIALAEIHESVNQPLKLRRSRIRIFHAGHCPVSGNPEVKERRQAVQD